MNGRGLNGGGCRFPFTASQWQELEHQALIFKYMVSGAPIPPELLFNFRRNLDSKLFPHHPTPSHIGWSCFQMGVGRKIDPEPGRCRRTDGKKWRCSKEVFQDLKYCEKHMHRGKNRSRKPVEQQQVINNNTNSSSSSSSSTPHHHLFTSSMLKPTNNNITTQLTHYSSLSSSSSVTSDNHLYPFPYYTNNNIHPYHHSRLIDSTHLGSYHRSRYNSNNIQGGALKEKIDEHAFLFNENCGTMKRSSSIMEDPWQLTMSSGRNNSMQTGSGQYPFLQLQGIEDSNSELGQSHQMKQYYDSSQKDSRRSDHQRRDQFREVDDHPISTQKTVYRFLEEYPPENKDDKSSNCSSSYSTTQLSISIPATTTTSHHLFPLFNNADSYHSQI